MEDRSSFALKVLAVSLVLGIAGDLLLRATPWGVNLPIWVVLATLCGYGLWRKSPVSISRTALWMALPILAFSLCFVWRDADELKVANGTAVALAIGMLALRSRKGHPAQGGIVEYTFQLIAAWFMFSADFAHLVTKDLDWKGNPKTEARVTGFFRGIVLASPLLLVFGALLAQGDAAFSEWLSKSFRFDPLDAFELILFFVVATLVAGGLFRRLFLRAEVKAIPSEEKRQPLSLSIGTVEIATVFGLLDLLFLIFVVIQFRYFFGGMSQVSKIAGLTYAEYARSGFFELTSASALVLPVVLGAHALLPKGSKLARKVFSGFTSILVGCVFVVLLSALQRMNLYVSVYGLSELRVFTTSFMVWVALSLVWLVITVVRHKRERFAFGALVAGYAVILGLNVVNPDALIARINMDPRKSVDNSYLATLSFDAAPTLASRLGMLRPGDRDQLVPLLEAHWKEMASNGDWRSMNLARLKFLESRRSR